MASFILRGLKQRRRPLPETCGNTAACAACWTEKNFLGSCVITCFVSCYVSPCLQYTKLLYMRWYRIVHRRWVPGRPHPPPPVAPFRLTHPLLRPYVYVPSRVGIERVVIARNNEAHGYNGRHHRSVILAYASSSSCG